MKRKVYIPAQPQHEGFHGVFVWLEWVCPKCGSERGEPFNGKSYDGSRILSCDQWNNACGHVDKYTDMIMESIRGAA